MKDFGSNYFSNTNVVTKNIGFTANMNYLIILSIKFDKDIAAVHMYIFTTAADKDHYKFTPVTTNSPSDLLTYDGTNIKATLNENRWGTLSLIPIGYNDN